MDHPLLFTHEIPKGFTWTLASRLGDMLTLAEKLFGPRNKEFTILGFEFSSTGPMIWYPKSSTNIVIQLSREAFHSEELALYQLAHETIHLLSPSGTSKANVLEEGLAVYFSWYYIEKVFNTKGESLTRSSEYNLAGLLVKKLLLKYPGFFFNLRSSKPNLWEIEESDLMAFAPDLGRAEAEILMLPFQDFKALSLEDSERLYPLREYELLFQEL